MTLGDISDLSQNTTIAIQPFSPSINALNQFSYAIQGIAFLPLVGKTLFEIRNFFRFVFNASDKKETHPIDLKRTLFASVIAGIGTVSYAFLGWGAKENYEVLQQLKEKEELGVPEILPDFESLPYFSLLILVLIIYGGASDSAKKIYDMMISPSQRGTANDEHRGRPKHGCFHQFFTRSKSSKDEEAVDPVEQPLSPIDSVDSVINNDLKNR